MGFIMYQYMIFGICLLIDFAWFKQCEERPLNIVIDSTNSTTRKDFDALRNIIKDITTKLQGADNKHVSINLYPYSDNVVCNNKLSSECVKRSNNVSDATSKEIISFMNVSSLRYHRYKKQPFCLACAEFIKEHLMKQSDDQDAFGLILATYPSLKNYINSSHHSRYKKNASYYLALLYNSTNTGVNNKRRPRIYARRITKNKQLSKIILSFICPDKFPNNKLNSTLQESASSDILTTRHELFNSPPTVNSKIITPTTSLHQIKTDVDENTFELNSLHFTTVLKMPTYMVKSTHLDYATTQSLPLHPSLTSLYVRNASIVVIPTSTASQTLEMKSRHVRVSITPWKFTENTASRKYSNLNHSMSGNIASEKYVTPSFDIVSIKTELLISRLPQKSSVLSAANVSLNVLVPKNMSVMISHFSPNKTLHIPSNKRLLTVASLNISKTIENSKIPILKSIAMYDEYSSRYSSTLTTKGVTKYFGNSTDVLITMPSKSTEIRGMYVSSYSSSVHKRVTKYFGNSTNVLIPKPSKSTEIRGMYVSSYSSSVHKRVTKYFGNSTNVLIPKPSKSTEIRGMYVSSYSSSVPEGLTKYFGDSTNVLIAKPSMSTEIQSMYKSSYSSSVPKRVAKYFGNSTNVLIMTPLMSTQMYDYLTYLSSVVPERKTKYQNVTDVLIMKVTRSEQYSSHQMTMVSDIISQQSTLLMPSLTTYASPTSHISYSNIIMNTVISPSKTKQITSSGNKIGVLSTWLHQYPTTSLSLGEVTQISTISVAGNRTTSYYTAMSSVFLIPKFNKVIANINFFMQQNVTKLHFKQKAWVNDFIINTSLLLNEINQENENSLIYEKSLNFLDFVENTTLMMGKELPTGKNVSRKTKDLILEIIAVDPLKFNGYIFTPVTIQQEESVQLSSDLFKNISLPRKKISITSMYMSTIPAMRKTKGHFQDIGKLFTISLDVCLEYPVQKTLTYTFKVPDNNYSNYKCVFWNSSDWDTEGCRVVNVSGTLVMCECDHLTSFSLLVQVSDFEIEPIHTYVLSIISYVGCSISIIGCILLILTFVMFGRLLKICRNVIHINLAIAITISNGLFISADAVHMYSSLCLTVSIAMLYTYLASFFWMLVEGIHVYLMIVKVFKSPNMLKVYLVLGWVVPAAIVAIAGLKFHVNFTRDDFCWISTEGNVIWVFVGPVLLIVIVNSIVLVTALSTSYKMAIAESDFLKLQQIARLTMLLMPIFGLTWLFGLLAINKQLIIFQYIFTIINSLQGVYIFVCYCLLNNEVKQEYERIRRKYQYGSAPSASSESNFSVYDQLFTRRLKSVVSVDSSAMVKLTKYDSKLNRYDSVKTDSTRASSTYSDTLAKRLNTNYSIELINLNDSSNICANDTESISSSVCAEEHDYGLKLQYDDVPLTNGHNFPSNDFVTDNCTYDTFKANK